MEENVNSSYRLLSTFLNKSIEEAFETDTNTEKTELILRHDKYETAMVPIHDHNETAQQFERNKTFLQRIMDTFDQSELYNIFDRVRDWVFIYSTVLETSPSPALMRDLYNQTRAEEPIVDLLMDKISV